LLDGLIAFADDLETDPDLEPSIGWTSECRLVSHHKIVGCVEADLEWDGGDRNESDLPYPPACLSRPPAILSAPLPEYFCREEGGRAIVPEVDPRALLQTRGVRT
jgi:hypothetical protein